MHKSLFSVAVLVAVLGTGAAFAGQTTAEITSLDEGAKTVTLSNGTVYSFNNESESYLVLGGYQPGDTVRIIWDMVGDKHEALAMSPDFSGSVFGTISAVSQAKQSVTLEDGTVYSFLHGDEEVDVGGFKAGDAVKIIATSQGGNHLGRSIQATNDAEMTGKLKAIDIGMKTVTFENDEVFSFDNDTNAALGGFKVGDMVSVTSFTAGDHNWVTSISPAKS